MAFLAVFLFVSMLYGHGTAQTQSQVAHCVDYDSRCSLPEYQQICKDPDPLIVQYNTHKCPLSCNLCKEYGTTTMAPQTTTNAPTETYTYLPAEPISCHLCRGPRFICERSHVPSRCTLPGHQYCMNDVENLENGSRYVTRRCATKAECDKDWLQESADRNECLTYDVLNLVDQHFYCSFCCKGDNCNVETVPVRLVTANDMQPAIVG